MKVQKLFNYFGKKLIKHVLELAGSIIVKLEA